MSLLEDAVARLRDLLAGRTGTPSTPVAVPPAPATLAGGTLPAGLVQPDRTTCGSACLVVARALGDASYAGWLATGEVAGRPGDGRTPEQRFADEVLATHVRTNRWVDASGGPQAAWPRGLGTTPWAVARELTATGGTTPPGTRHRVRAIAPRDRATAFDEAARAVALGHAVPLFVGNALLPRHVVLVTGGDEQRLTAYDPTTGGRARLTRDDFDRGTLRVSGWSEPWFTVLPIG